MKVGEAFVEIRPDTSKFEGQAKQGILGPIKGIAAAAAGAFAAVGVANFTKSVISSASNLNENLSKNTAVFGDWAIDIEQFAETAAKNVGLSQNAALEATGTFGNLFTQLGIGRDDAMNMSTAMVELAADFGSFHNADITEVIQAQSAAFRGEYDAVQRFVPTINAAAVEQKALAMTSKESAKQLTAQEKALATQALLMDGAGKAAGDFARTSGGLANRQRILAAQFEDIKAKIGQALLPVMVNITGFLTEKLLPAFGMVQAKLRQWAPAFREAFDRVRQIVATVVEFVRGLLKRFGQDHDNAATGIGRASSRISETLARLRETFASMFEAIRVVVVRVVEVVTLAWDSFGRGLVDNLRGAFEGIATIANGLLTTLSGVFDLIAAVLTGKWGKAWEALQTIFSGAWETLKGTIKTAWEGLRGSIEFVLGLIELAWKGTWNALKTFVGDIWEGVKTITRRAVDWIIDEVDRALGPVDDLLAKVLRFVTGGAAPGFERERQEQLGGLGGVGRFRAQTSLPLALAPGGTPAGGVTQNVYTTINGADFDLSEAYDVGARVAGWRLSAFGKRR